MAERLRKKAKKRNQVIHGQISIDRRREVTNEGDKVTQALMLLPQVYMQELIGPSSDKYKYSSDDLLTIGNNLDAVREDFNAFGDDVVAAISARDNRQQTHW